MTAQHFSDVLMITNYMEIARQIKAQRGFTLDHRELLPNQAGRFAQATIDRVAMALADSFEEFNPSFDRLLFLQACGVTTRLETRTSEGHTRTYQLKGLLEADKNQLGEIRRSSYTSPKY